MRRKYESLNVVNMFATLTLETWKSVLVRATKSRNTNKLMAYRYGLQAGLTDAIKNGMNDPNLEIWVIKRTRDIEKCMRFILNQNFPGPKFDPKKDREGYVRKAIEAKRKRERELERFLQESSF